MARALRYLAIIAATVGGSFATFVILLYRDPRGWESHEYSAIAFWSVPLAFLVLALGKLGRRRLRERSVAIRLAVATGTTIIAAIAWTFMAVVLTGGYALAFDANPFYCWLVGSSLGTFLLHFWPRLIEREKAVARAAV